MELTVEEAADLARRAWPITVGVPFAQGQLADAATLRLTLVGKPLPLQALVTAKWRDGSVKWALLDTQADLPASGKGVLTLAWSGGGAAPPAPAKLAVQATPEGVTVSTGALSFRLTPGGGGIPEDVKLASGTLVSKGGAHTLAFTSTGPELNPPEKRGNWKRPAPKDAQIKELAATGAKAEVIIEQQNELRATILVKGWYQKGEQKACRFDVRVSAFAGKPFVRIQHTLTYTEDPKLFFVRGLALRFGLDGAREAEFGGAGAQLHTAPANPGAYLLALGPEIHHNGIKVEDAPKKAVTYDVCDAAGNKLPKASGMDPAGFVSLVGAQAGLTVGVRDFRRLHPKELLVDAQGVEVGLWPRHGDLLIDCRNSGYGQKIRGETTLNGVACGWAKTHQLWVSYHAADAAGRKAGQEAVRAGGEPAWAAPAPKHVCDSGALGVLAPVERTQFPGMERQHDAFWAWVDKNRELFRWDGFFDYGGILIEFDNHGQRYSNGPRGTWCWRDYAGWILNDGQLAHHLFRAYARSGERHYLKSAEAVARNIGDETTVHHFNPKVPDAHPVGGAHRHDMLPWGAIVTTYGMDVLGNCDLWFLTGDLRARDVLRDYADNLGKGGPGLVERHGVGSLLCRLGEALAQPALIELGKKNLPADLEEAARPNFRTWTDTFMAMILAYDITGDAAIKKALLGAAAACGGSGSQYGAEVTAWAYLQTKEAQYLEALKKCLAKNPNIPQAAANAGDPWKEDWKALRARMEQMPAWYVKVYINTQEVGRYPSAIRALNAAGINEKGLGLK